MKILVVSQYFWPENFRINDLCAELASRGHEVTVLTGVPNYPEGEVFEDYINSPKNFNNYKGCKLVRVPMVSRGKGSSIKLMLNYLTFALSAMFIGGWKLQKKTFDVIFVFEPSPITVGLPAIYFKKIKKAPIVFWVLDLWPESLEATGVVKSKLILKTVGKLVSFIYNRCDLILGQSKGFYSAISCYCKDSSKIKYFPNWSENLFLSPSVEPNAKIAEFNGFKVLFAGNVGKAQDFSAILNMVNILKEQELNIKVFIVGEGRDLDWVKLEIKNRELSNYICLLGRHPLESMPDFFTSADALLVTLKDSPIFNLTIPGKIQSYMAARKPILTMLSGEGSKIVEEAGCGYIASSGDYKKLALNVINMSKLSSDELKEMGTKARRYSDIEFNRDKLISQLEGWFIELLDNSKGLGKEGKGHP